ncbi:MAG: hypothetical protein FWE31_01285 [Firmicutes bacterium]|nr:hypothetical protein [Bacillota bacterium]
MTKKWAIGRLAKTHMIDLASDKFANLTLAQLGIGNITLDNVGIEAPEAKKRLIQFFGANKAQQGLQSIPDDLRSEVLREIARGHGKKTTDIPHYSRTKRRNIADWTDEDTISLRLARHDVNGEISNESLFREYDIIDQRYLINRADVDISSTLHNLYHAKLATMNKGTLRYQEKADLIRILDLLKILKTYDASVLISNGLINFADLNIDATHNYLEEGAISKRDFEARSQFFTDMKGGIGSKSDMPKTYEDALHRVASIRQVGVTDGNSGAGSILLRFVNLLPTDISHDQAMEESRKIMKLMEAGFWNKSNFSIGRGPIRFEVGKDDPEATHALGAMVGRSMGEPNISDYLVNPTLVQLQSQLPPSQGLTIT